MPALPPTPVPVLRYQLHWSVGAVPFASSHFYYQYSGTAPTAAQLAAHTTTVTNAVTADLLPMMTGQNTYLGCTVTDISSASGAVGQGTASAIGTRTGAQLDAAACTLLNMTIARRYRGGKPRIYLPFGVSTDLTGTVSWSTTYTAAMATAWANFNSAVSNSMPGTTTQVGRVNVSYYSGFESAQNPVTKRWHNYPTPRATPVVDTILSTVVNAKVGSQRRRIQA